MTGLFILALNLWPWHGSGEAMVLPGTVEARQVRPAFQVPGRIRALRVDEGMEVREGQLLAELDDTDYRLALREAVARRDAAAARLAELEAGSRPQEVREAEAALEEAEAELAFATLELKRIRDLVRRKMASQEQLDRARFEKRRAEAARERARQRLLLLREGPRRETVQRARAELAAAEAAVEKARQNLAYTRLVSPTDGVVSVRLAEAGEVVERGKPVFEIDALRRPWVRAYLNERDLTRVRLGQAVEVRADGLPGRVFPGRLAFISPRAEFTPKTVETRALRVDLVYRIKVAVDNPEGLLKLGMPVDITFP